MYVAAVSSSYTSNVKGSPATDGFLSPSDNDSRLAAVAFVMRRTLPGSTVRARLVTGLAATIAIVPHTSQAQTGITGKWFVHYEHEVRSGHLGGPLVSRMVTDTVHITLRQKGDSILGEWQAIAAAGETPPSARTLVGVLQGDTARLEIDPNVAATEGYFAELGREIVEFLKEHIHGITPTTMKLELTARGDSLVGSRWSSSADGTESTRRSLRGIRAKP